MTNRFRGPLASIGAIVLFLSVLVVLGQRLYEHFPSATEVEGTRWALGSYRDVMYWPTRAMLDGINPYDSVQDDSADRYMNRYPVTDHLPLYSPVLLLISIPLAGLELHASMVLFQLLNIALIIVLAAIAVRVSGKRLTVAAVLIVATMLLLSQPGRAVFNSGQIAPMLAIATFCALHWASRQTLWAGVSGALATLKPTIGVPNGFLMIAAGEFRAGIWALLLGGGGFLVGLAVVFSQCDDLSLGRAEEIFTSNIDQFQHDISTTAIPNAAASESNTSYERSTARSFRVDAAAALEYLFHQRVGGRVTLGLALLIFGSTALVLWKSRRRSQPFSGVPPASALIILSTFVGYYHGVYDILTLVVPLAACTFAVGQQWQAIPSRMRHALVCLILVPFVNIFWTEGWWNLVENFLGEAFVYSTVGTTIHGLTAAADGIALVTAWCLMMYWVARQ